VNPKIFPRNLSARAVANVAGNPVGTRLESGVGNCYPGLEFDHRNLDRRFFPGLIFNFVSQDDAATPQDEKRGARLMALELSDPDLDVDASKLSEDDRKTRRELSDSLGAAQTAIGALPADWYLSSVEQNGRRLSMRRQNTDAALGSPLDGMIVWRLIRSLRPGPVIVRLARREASASSAREIELKGWRRRFLDRFGVIPSVYRPGELTQSLCSPWQHDFRDCDCTYWASNHPDIVLGAAPVGGISLPSGAPADASRALTALDWLRADRSPEIAVPAATRREDNRPYQLDHYEINSRWQELSFALEGREIDRVYQPRPPESAAPFANAEELADRLVDLATLEHALTVEYLYALYSLRAPDEIDSTKWPMLPDHLVFVRHQLLQIAVSEMRHLRWANELLWRLSDLGLVKPREPSLGIATTIPRGGDHTRPTALRRLDDETLADFIAVEAPSNRIDGQYSRVVATLRQPGYEAALYTIAAQIVADGSEHYSRFREIGNVLSAYAAAQRPYLREISPADPAEPEVANALTLYHSVVDGLAGAYRNTGTTPTAAEAIVEARKNMLTINKLAEELARRGKGLPFFSLPEGDRDAR